METDAAARRQAAPPAGPGRRLLDLLVHLRLHFQAMLGSIFLFGYVLAGGEPEPRGLAAFAVLHVLLYGGATAFNSYFDRDVGPVGGLAVPPPARRELLPFSLALQLAGLGASLAIGPAFAAVYSAMFLLGIGYSHPAVRWKARPWSSLLVVSIGQGVLGFAAGVAAALPRSAATGPLPVDPAAPILDLDLALGALVATLVTTGLYPLTQVYQIEEDRSRGDRTFAVAFGPRGCFRVSLLLLGLAGAGGVALFARRFEPWQAAAVAVVIATVWLRIASWARAYREGDPIGAMKRAMRLAYVTSGGFGLFLIARLAGLL